MHHAYSIYQASGLPTVALLLTQCYHYAIMSSASSPCCPPNSIGAVPLSNEATTGRFVLIPASQESQRPPLDAYVAGNLEGAKRVILLLTDVFGINSGNHQVIADRLAKSLSSSTRDGSTTATAVVIPDFFRKRPILIETPWMNQHLPQWFNQYCIATPQIVWNCKMRVTDVALEKDLNELVWPWIQQQQSSQEKENKVQLSCVGFCFGGWLTAHFLGLSSSNQDGNSNGTHDDRQNSRLQPPPIVCGVGIHPSFRMEVIHGRSEVDVAQRVGTKPILLLPAGNDTALLPNKKNEAVRILAQARHLSDDETQVANASFLDMVHGWVSRGDTLNP
jgi:dienelactone hydrolase